MKLPNDMLQMDILGPFYLIIPVSASVIYRTENLIHINATAMEAMANATATLLIFFLLKFKSALLT